eukprot:UN05951
MVYDFNNLKAPKIPPKPDVSYETLSNSVPIMKSSRDVFTKTDAYENLLAGETNLFIHFLKDR